MRALIGLLAIMGAACTPEPVAVEAQLTGQTLTISGRRSVTIELDWKADELVLEDVRSVSGDRRPDLIRWFSPALYERLGQPSPAYIIYSRDVSADTLLHDATPGWVASYPEAPAETPTDQHFADKAAVLQATNVYRDGLAICAENYGGPILDALAAGECYVACSGEAIVIADLAPTASQTALLWPVIDEIAPDVLFTRSEGHTAVELAGAEGWYVADPTYGFAYAVKDGQRLDVQGLIHALEQPEGLWFAMAWDGRLHRVPAEDAMREYPAMRALYYTPDKQLELLPRNQAEAT